MKKLFLIVLIFASMFIVCSCKSKKDDDKENEPTIELDGLYTLSLLASTADIELGDDMYISIDNYVIDFCDFHKCKLEKITSSKKLTKLSKFDIRDRYYDLVEELNSKTTYYGYQTLDDDPIEGYILEHKDQLYAYYKIESEEFFAALKPAHKVNLKYYDDGRFCDKEYYIDRSKELSFKELGCPEECNTFIDVDTLTIYRDSIIVDKSYNLVGYNEQEGLASSYIEKYLFEKGNFHFDSRELEKADFNDYNYTIINEDYIIRVDGIVYTVDIKKPLKIVKIDTNKPIFDSFENDLNILRILFGTDNKEFNSGRVIITLKDEGYIIEFKDSYY